MKILFYNWVQFDDPEKRGGGVSVYQKNLIEKLSADRTKEIYFLSSGIAYNFFRRRSYYRRTNNIFRDRCRSFELVNSAVLSPGHFCYDSDSVLKDARTGRVLMEFISRYGPFDVIHLNNLEGMPAEVLSLKDSCPKTKLLLMLHNYYPFCPQVNLWKRESETCRDYQDGFDCINCLPHRVNREIVVAAHCLAFHLKSIGVHPDSWLFKRAFAMARPFYAAYRFIGRVLENRELRAASEGDAPVLRELSLKADYFANRRKTFVSLINKHVDKVLAVSSRVSEIAENYGIEKDKLEIAYIGTIHAEGEWKFPKRRDFEQHLTLCYMGYMRRDKGFYFFLHTLEQMPEEMAERINVIFAAKNTDNAAYERIEMLGKRLNKVFYTDGYAHEQLDEILRDADLGVIPVLWEDNLPQVAIEMVSHGVPILTSDLGGASELGNNADFIFKNDDVVDFLDKLKRLLNREIRLEAFWDHAMKLVTFDEHVKQLQASYND
jgi:glycosyltransferase involved in cell wall biosynthesis